MRRNVYLPLEIFHYIVSLVPINKWTKCDRAFKEKPLSFYRWPTYEERYKYRYGTKFPQSDVVFPDEEMKYLFFAGHMYKEIGKRSSLVISSGLCLRFALEMKNTSMIVHYAKETDEDNMSYLAKHRNVDLRISTHFPVSKVMNIENDLDWFISVIKGWQSDISLLAPIFYRELIDEQQEEALSSLSPNIRKSIRCDKISFYMGQIHNGVKIRLIELDQPFEAEISKPETMLFLIYADYVSLYEKYSKHRHFKLSAP